MPAAEDAAGLPAVPSMRSVSAPSLIGFSIDHLPTCVPKSAARTGQATFYLMRATGLQMRLQS